MYIYRKIFWKEEPKKVIVLYLKYMCYYEVVPEYRGTREILWESTATMR